MEGEASIFQCLHDWLGGSAGRAYGISALQAEAGWTRFAARPMAEHFNPLGTVHGGYTATLFDAALGLAVYSAAGSDVVHVTAKLEVTYLRPIEAQVLPLSVEARLLRREGRAVLADATLRDCHGRLCAQASARFVQPGSAPGVDQGAAPGLQTGGSSSLESAS
ncbi:PaaI family thioesterase [Pseudomonas benzenivorans]|uniref:PaaI family thioesterase n=1 Tax=Pseudomonas benzenivorans TaxID=556533 RepID=UPI00351240AF